MQLPAPLRAVASRVEAVTLSFAVLIALAVLAFSALASEMTEGELDGFDRTIILALRESADPAEPIGGARVETAMRDVTALGGVTVLGSLTLLVVVFLALKGQRGSAITVAVATLGGQAISNGAKWVFDRPRPDLVPHGVETISASFPSGHSMMAAVTYLTLAVMLARVEPRRRIKVFLIAVAVTITVAVGISRVYLGVHWPSDVMAGWAAGAAWALLCYLVAHRLGREGRIEPNQGE